MAAGCLCRPVPAADASAAATVPAAADVSAAVVTATTVELAAATTANADAEPKLAKNTIKTSYYESFATGG